MAEKTTAECLAILDLERPRFSGKSQDEVDAKVAAWKADVLKPAYRARAKVVHPDVAADPDAEDQFKAVRAAYEQLLRLHVKLSLPKNKCPSGHDRFPETAKYCHECGYCYEEDPFVARLRSAGITTQTIAHIRESGDYDRLRAMSPLSEALSLQIRILQQRQRLGLFGVHSGW